MDLTFSFPDTVTPVEVGRRLAYWAAVIQQGGDRVTTALQQSNSLVPDDTRKAINHEVNPNEGPQASEPAADPETTNVVDLSKAAKSREAARSGKKEPAKNAGGGAGRKVAPKSRAKKPEELTEAAVRSHMIDYVNVASKKMDCARKEVFKGLLGEFAVGKLGDLPEDKYEAMIALVDERTKELEKM